MFALRCLRSNIDWSLLNRSQYVYVKGKSVESALHDMTDFVEPNLVRGENTVIFPRY